MNVPNGSTLGELLQELKRKHPALPPARNIVAAVNQEYATHETELYEGDEIALIPPVSGGAPC